MAISKAQAAVLLRIKKAYADPKIDVRKASKIYFRASKTSKPEFDDYMNARLVGLAERQENGGFRITDGTIPKNLPVNWNKLDPPLFNLNDKKSWAHARKQEKECNRPSSSKEASPKPKTKDGARSSRSRSTKRSPSGTSASPSSPKNKPSGTTKTE